MVMACWQASKAIWLESRCNTVNPLPAAAKAMTNTTAMIMADFFAFHTFATAEVRGASEEGSRAGMEPCSGTVEGKRYTRSPMPECRPTFPPLRSSIGQLYFLLAMRDASLLPLSTCTAPLYAAPFTLFVTYMFYQNRSPISLRCAQLFTRISLLPIYPRTNNPYEHPQRIEGIALELDIQICQQDHPTHRHLVPCPVTGDVHEQQHYAGQTH